MVRDCWIALKLLVHWLPFNRKIIHQILHENFGQRRSLWILFCMTSLMSSLCYDDFIMANDSVMEISHPPYSVKNFEKDWTAKLNAVPLDVFSDYFVQLLEMCKKWVAVEGIIVKSGLQSRGLSWKVGCSQGIIVKSGLQSRGLSWKVGCSQGDYREKWVAVKGIIMKSGLQSRGLSWKE